MLDRLPPELLAHVLRCAAPLDARRDKVKERRELLRNCCLADKRMKEVAQPMLPEVFFAHGKDPQTTDLKKLERGGRTRGSLVKMLILERMIGGEPRLGNAVLQSLLHLCPGVEHLRACGCGILDLSWLSGNSKLRSVVFGRCTLGLSPYPPHFPNLVEASFCLCRTFRLKPSTPPLLTSANMPALRALALEDATHLHNDLPSFLDSSVFSRLEAFVSDPVTLELISGKVNLPPIPIQLRAFPPDAKTFLSPGCAVSPVHLALMDHWLGWHDIVYEPLPLIKELQNLCDTISTSLPALRTLDLPDLWHPGQAGVSEDTSARISSILSAFEQRGVTVTWSRYMGEDESRISPSFWQRMKEEKARGETVTTTGGTVRSVKGAVGRASAEEE